MLRSGRLLVFTIFLLSPVARGQSFEIGAGLTSYQMQKLSITADGTKSMDGTRFYYFHLQYNRDFGAWSVGAWLRGMPESLNAVESTSASSKTSLTSLGLPFRRKLTPRWFLLSGPVLQRYTVRGLGGKEVLDNGESTAEFFRPSASRTANSFVWQLGTAYRLAMVTASFDFILHAPLQSTQRSFSTMFTIAWSHY